MNQRNGEPAVGADPGDESMTGPTSAERSLARPNRIQRFTIVGAAATVVDVGLLLWLLSKGAHRMYADMVSVSAAGVVSHLLHRLVTLSNNPGRRWYERFAGSYFSALFGSLAMDVVVFTVAMDVVDDRSTISVLACKALALLAAVTVRRSAYRSILGHAIRSAQQTPTARLHAEDGPRLSVIVPAFREADRIGTTLEAIRRELTFDDEDGVEQTLEIVVVDDGSTDDTTAQAQAAGADQVITLPENKGKGAAVRAGMLAATGRTRAFIDADLAYSPDQILGLLERVEDGWDVVVGSRGHTSTTTLVKAGRLREIGSRVVNLLTSVALLGQYRDTQCGLKAFSADAAERIFSVARIDRFAMDIEVIFLVERLGLTLHEVPVTVTNSERSTVHVVRDTARLLRDVVRIRVLAKNGTYASPSTGGRDTAA